MKQPFAHHVVTRLLDDDANPRNESEWRLIMDMRCKPVREQLADLLLVLGRDGLRLWMESLLEEVQEHPAATQAAAQTLLENLEPILRLAGTLLKETAVH